MAEEDDVGPPGAGADREWYWNRLDHENEPESRQKEDEDDGKRHKKDDDISGEDVNGASEAGSEPQGPTTTQAPEPPEEQDSEPPPPTPPPPAGRDVAALRPLYRARPREFYLLWLLAVLTYGVGDTLTTSVALIDPSVQETNPVVAFLITEMNIAGFLGLKLVLFLVLIAISAKGAIDGDRLAYYAPPVFALGLGTALTLWNLFSVGFL